MFNAKRLFGYMATGVMPEMTALDESLAEHDRKYHPDGYQEGDECNKREGMASGDWVDKVEVKGQRSEVKQRNGTSSDRGNGVTAEEDAAYMDAVKRGDMETCARMVREAAAKEMPDTKVVDKDGLPKVVYHATDYEFTKFDKNKLGRLTEQNSGNVDLAKVGFWFNENNVSKLLFVKKALPVFLNIENPAEMSFDEMYDGARDGQADGYVVDDTELGGKSFVALSPSQIKSSDPVTYDDAGNIIPLSRRFDFTSDDIRY